MTGTIRCVVFDFDGVLVDSNPIKRRAYYDVFESVGLAPDVVAECLEARTDGDRRDVIECIVATMQAEPGSFHHLVNSYVEAYGRRCDEQILTCAEVAGASELLRMLADRYPLYVNSATPEQPLQDYVRSRGWSRYFRRALGRPGTKIDNLGLIRRLEAIESSEMVFVGDRQSDFVAARATNCRFVALRSDENDFVEAVDRLEALPRLPDYLKSLGAGRW